MSRPWPHPKTGVFWFRKRVPKDMLALVGKREEKASLGTKDVAEAKRRHAAHAVLVERRWENLRVGVRRLSLLEVNAIAGEFYEDLIPERPVGGTRCRMRSMGRCRKPSEDRAAIKQAVR
jgi:hypothetical protein